jgi:hypothetical protein
MAVVGDAASANSRPYKLIVQLYATGTAQPEGDVVLLLVIVMVLAAEAAVAASALRETDAVH